MDYYLWSMGSPGFWGSLDAVDATLIGLWNAKLANLSTSDCFRLLCSARQSPTNSVMGEFYHKVVDEKAKNMLSEFCPINDLAFFPIPVVHENPNTPPILGYYLIRLNRWVHCIDFERSAVTYYDSTGPRRYFIPFGSLVIDKTKIPADAVLFRPFGEPSIVILRGDAVTAIRKRKLTGFEFYLLPSSGQTDWEDPSPPKSGKREWPLFRRRGQG